MTEMRRASIVAFLVPLLAACGSDPAPGDPVAGAAPPAAAIPAPASPAAGSEASPPAGGAPGVVAGPWRSQPADGVRISGEGPVTVETGPHVVAWPEGAAALRAPYSLSATLHKRAGRLHEGYGLVFGGDPLDAPEAEQRYGYFLVRGDGSYLIKRRDGAATQVVRDWTTHPAVRRDESGAGRPNALRVAVLDAETVFYVNDQEVARVPAAELHTAGLPGVRAAHDVRLEIADFQAGPTLPDTE